MQTNLDELMELLYTEETEKSKQYNFDSPQHPIKNCLLCNKPFEPSGRNWYFQNYCSRDHFVPCQVCGKPVKQDPPSDWYIKATCSRQCTNKFRAIRTKEVVREKYGVDNILDLPQYRAKAIQGIRDKAPETTKKVVATMKERYGGMGTASPILRPKIENTMNERYGVTNPDELPEFRKKIRDRLKSEETIEKKKAASRIRWGTDYPSQSEEVQKQMQATTLAHWGVPFSGQIPEARAKSITTNLARYGVPCTLQTPQAMEAARQKLIENRTGRVSKRNMAFLDKLHAAGFGDAETETYIKPIWFDIVIPSLHVLMEIDPSYTHSEIPSHWDTKGKDTYYHRDRTLVAENNGYRCIHVFDWDDDDRIIAMLQAHYRIYARQCTVIKLDTEQASQFIDSYHLQGNAKGAQYLYGLIYNNELIQVMTFGPPRYNKNYQWELLRLCTKTDHAVIGGASKLFKAFIREVDPDSILSYCDRAKFSGDVYKAMGMNLHHTTSPAKVWSKGSQKITDNLLRQRGYDQLFGTDYGKGTSNEELMVQNGWLPVYDCGQLVFEWRKQ